MSFLQKLPKNLSHRIPHILLGIAIVGMSLVAGPLAGAEAVPVVAQGFKTSGSDIVTGAIVSRESGDSNIVRLAARGDTRNMLGVANNKPLIALNESEQEVQVVTSGLTPTLVSDINGPVRAGDKIALSPIKGVGMRATSAVITVGTAQAALDDRTAERRVIKDVHGSGKEVRIDTVPVYVQVATYEPADSGASYVPPVLQSIANHIGGQDVSPPRVLVAACMFLLLFVSISVVLYSAIRSSITSIGRNPLSEGAVRKSLGQVALTITTIVVLAVLTIYFVLTI